jgi:cation transport ATPase
MTAEQLETSRRRFEVAGAIICAHCFGWVLWIIQAPNSMGRATNADYISLIGFICITLTFYLGAYRFLDRYCILPFQSMRPNWIFISFFGTSLSLIIGILPRFMNSLSVLDDFLVSFLFILGVFNLLMLPVMALVWSVGFLARLVRKEIEYARVVTN